MKPSVFQSNVASIILIRVLAALPLLWVRFLYDPTRIEIISSNLIYIFLWRSRYFPDQPSPPHASGADLSPLSVSPTLLPPCSHSLLGHCSALSEPSAPDSSRVIRNSLIFEQEVVIELNLHGRKSKGTVCILGIICIFLFKVLILITHYLHVKDCLVLGTKADREQRQLLRNADHLRCN